MKRYNVTLFAKKHGAIGAYHHIHKTVRAETEPSADDVFGLFGATYEINWVQVIELKTTER